jgi:hypothetical protein
MASLARPEQQSSSNTSPWSLCRRMSTTRMIFSLFLNELEKVGNDRDNEQELCSRDQSKDEQVAKSTPTLQ